MKKENSPALKKEIQAAQTFLSNLNTESQVALQRRNQLRLDIEAESAKLLAERKSALEKVDLEWKKKLEKYEDREQELKNSIGNREFNLDSLDSKISGKISELNALHEQLGNVKTLIEAENSKITVLVSQQTGVEASIDSLKEQISPLVEELNSIKTEIKKSEPKKAELIDLITSKTSEYQALLETSERDLTVLKDQKSSINREIVEAQKTFKAEREDLSNRKMAADKRDDNLRAREYKVNRDEQMIEQNAGLLNL